LESLKRKVENTKALYEYAKEQYELAERRTLETGGSKWVFTTHLAMEAYSFSVERYLRATIELNQYLFDREFPERAKVLGAAV